MYIAILLLPQLLELIWCCNFPEGLESTIFPACPLGLGLCNSMANNKSDITLRSHSPCQVQVSRRKTNHMQLLQPVGESKFNVVAMKNEHWQMVTSTKAAVWWASALFKPFPHRQPCSTCVLTATDEHNCSSHTVNYLTDAYGQFLSLEI